MRFAKGIHRKNTIFYIIAALKIKLEVKWDECYMRNKQEKRIALMMIVLFLIVLVSLLFVHFNEYNEIDKALIGKWVDSNNGTIWEFKKNQLIYIDGEHWGTYSTKDGELGLKYMDHAQEEPTYLYQYTINDSKLYCYDYSEDKERNFIKIE